MQAEPTDEERLARKILDMAKDGQVVHLASINWALYILGDITRAEACI